MFESEDINMNRPTILDLPIEMINMILNELDLPTLIKCKSIFEAIGIPIDSKANQLIIFQPDQYLFYFRKRCPYPAFHNPNHINQKRLLNLLDFNLDLESPNFMKFFVNLKELHFNMELIDFNLDIINQFKNLETLSFLLFIPIKDQSLNLPNLKNLIIINNNFMYGRFELLERSKKKYKIIVNSPLKRLKFNNEVMFTKYEFNTSNLEYLDIYGYYCTDIIYERTDDISDHYNLSNFKFVKVLYCYQGVHINILMQLTRLEEIHFQCFQYKKMCSIDPKLIDYLSELINLIRSKTLKIKRLYFCDIQLMIDPIKDNSILKTKNQVEWINNIILKDQLLNYELLDDQITSLTSIDYAFLINLLEENRNLFDNFDKDEQIPELPFDFFSKFENIRYLKISSINIDNKLIIFLKNFKQLFKLDIRNCLIKQSILDQLPYATNLLDLVLDNLEEYDYNKINFHFISKLNLIYSLKIARKLDQNLDLNSIIDLKNDHLSKLTLVFELDSKLAVKLFKNCKKLTSLHFYYLKKPLTIERYSAEYYRDSIEDLILGMEFSLIHDYDEISSEKYLKSNRKAKELFILRYFNRNVSVYELNYDQLIDYVENIPKIVQKELKKDKNAYRYAKFSESLDGKHFKNLLIEYD